MAREHALAVLTGDVARELGDTPSLADRFLLIPSARLCVLHPQQLYVMRPAQMDGRLCRRRLHNLWNVWRIQCTSNWMLWQLRISATQSLAETSLLAAIRMQTTFWR